MGYTLACADCIVAVLCQNQSVCHGAFSLSYGKGHVVAVVAETHAAVGVIAQIAVGVILVFFAGVGIVEVIIAFRIYVCGMIFYGTEMMAIVSICQTVDLDQTVFS